MTKRIRRGKKLRKIIIGLPIIMIKKKFNQSLIFSNNNIYLNIDFIISVTYYII